MPAGAEPRLAVVGYHRVGSRGEARFDGGVVTADADQLEKQIRYFQEHFEMVDLRRAIAIAAGRERCDRTAVLLTFDDGYIDNYEVAFPILRACGVPAVFFVVSSFAGGGVIPWWDRIAWMVKTAQVERFTLDDTVEFDLEQMSREEATEAVLSHFKAGGQTPEAFIETLEARCRPRSVAAGQELFLSWAQAREMAAAGMTIGAHTHTHPILSRLSKEEQVRELAVSKRILQRELGHRVDVLAYPVGGPSDFDAVTQGTAWDCGYRAAFSYHGGINRSGNTEQFDIKRIPVYWNARPEDLLDPE
jgi:peptidoglycan/xylan/chitin deacetylase (PgdA/CDA1 family)